MPHFSHWILAPLQILILTAYISLEDDIYLPYIQAFLIKICKTYKKICAIISEISFQSKWWNQNNHFANVIIINFVGSSVIDDPRSHISDRSQGIELYQIHIHILMNIFYASFVSLFSINVQQQLVGKYIISFQWDISKCWYQFRITEQNIIKKVICK